MLRKPRVQEKISVFSPMNFKVFWVKGIFLYGLIEKKTGFIWFQALAPKAGLRSALQKLTAAVEEVLASPPEVRETTQRSAVVFEATSSEWFCSKSHFFKITYLKDP